MRRMTLVLVLAATACSDPARDLATRGDEAVFAHEYQSAADDYEGALAECGDRKDEGTIRFKRGVLEKLAQVRQHYLHDVQGALRAYRIASDLEPGSDGAFQAHLRIVAILRDSVGDPGLAVAELSSVVETFADRPGLEPHRLELAQLAFRVRKYDEARVQAERVMAQGSAALKIEAAMLLASIHDVEGRVAEARRTYEDLLEMPLDPRLDARVRFELALCHERLNDLPAAIEQYTRALEGSTNPELVRARLTRVRTRLEGGTPRRIAAAPIPRELGVGAGD